ncbi:MAG: zinc ribbon domain-containing protein [Proteobacteria bacterium]|nr:zinc ribbon domain-containing protein [Pseudomonadota bacterium]
MNCPQCQHVNADGAKFCDQCGGTLASTASTPATTISAAPVPSAAPVAKPSSGSKTVLIVLGVLLGLLLLFVVGIYTAFHMVANKVRSIVAGDSQTTSQTQDGNADTGNGSGSSSTAMDPGVKTTGNVIDTMLGTDAKGRSDIGKALQGMQQAGQQIEQHDKATGNTYGAPDAQNTQQAVNAVGGLVGAMGHSLGGAHRHDPVDYHALEALLPAALPGMQRAAPRGQSDQAMGIKTTSADVDFTGSNGARINVSIKDATSISGLAGIAELADANETEQGDSYEKNINIGGRSVHAKWDGSAREGSLSLLVGKRFGVDVTGNGIDMDQLKSVLAQIDLGKLESMKDANPTAQ